MPLLTILAACTYFLFLFRSRYVRFNVPVTGKGWNNLLEDIIMLSETALMGKRGYVFPAYVWSAFPLMPVVFDHGHARSASIPLNAIVAGPVAGGPFPDSTYARSISEEWWEVVCPASKRVYVDVKAARQEMNLDGSFPDGKTVFEKWGKKLADMDAQCVEVRGDHIWSFG